MAYTNVSITDSTPYGASGKVSYASIFCSNDDYTVSANGGNWTASSRGVCLVTEISATVFTPSGPVVAAPYTSSGTAYSQFAIVQTGPNSYAVTRLTLAADSTDVGELEAEPTAQQK
ncbi:hypothetical protein [Hymenobacter convexus]|uniref:hypothetical protein n=1 Tax=Hymenobacter sp. CA1UV-4 TaxID=3063782 RepID=UPI0027127CF6|nr:hypothetical protein [Hymenobacter sp. CA1UV-4]MDO7850317.1 hypothetical protein [Hymenobacter sp. CA1UV-4]